MWSYVSPQALAERRAFMWQEVRDYVIITFGILVYAAGWVLFFIPYHITLGGVVGIGAITYYATGVPMQVTYFLINAALMVGALKFLGMRFFIRTAYGIAMMTLMLWLLQRYVNAGQLLGEGQDFMACILGSGLCGFGLATVFIQNGSTGGTDIIAAAVNKYRNISLGRIILYCDILIIASCYLVFQDWRRVLFGYAATFVANLVLDNVVNRNHQSVQFLIISSKAEEIADKIARDMNRGVTVLDGHGWYEQKPTKVLYVLAKRRESPTMLRLIKRIDENAFISESNVHGVFGRGFDKIKGK